MKIIIIGEKFGDKFVYGKCERLCSEAPVPVFVPTIIEKNIGGAGNVMMNCINIVPDAMVDLYSQKTMLSKTRYVDEKSNHIFLRVDDEVKIDKFDIDYISWPIGPLIIPADIVIVSDYNKGYLSDEDLAYIGKHSKLSILDSKRKLSKEIIDSYTFIKLNKEESKQNILTNNMLITLSERGCMYQGKTYNVTQQQTIDVSGAGDTFTSAFIIKYHKTKDIDTSINYANYCAGLVVSKKGVAVPFNHDQ